MALNLFRIDLSQLTSTEKSNLLERIDRAAFDTPNIIPGANYAEFYLDDAFDVTSLNIPEKCKLKHLS